MAVLPFAALFLLLCSGWWCTGVDALAKVSPRIPIYERQYLKDIRVGSPGKRLTLRMRWDLDDTYLYESPRTYSETFTDVGKQGTDLFYLRNDIEPVRLPVTYAQEPDDPYNKSSPFYNGARLDTNGGVTYHGSIGLGPNSPLWSVWTRFTVSTFTLTLGKDDDLDTLLDGDQADSASGQLFQATINSDGVTASIPVEFKLSEEFTYLPLSVFSDIVNALAITPRLPVKVQGDASSSEIEIWLSTTSSFVISPLGGPEDTLRLSEQEGRNKSEIIIGRIQLLSNFVVYRDLVRNITRIRQTYDTYPLSSTGQYPQAVMGLFAALLWCIWALVTTPSTYQWLVYGMLTHHKGSLAHLKKSIVKVSQKDKLIGAESLPPRDDASIQRQRNEFQQANNSGPVDWMLIRSLLFLARLVCFSTFVIAVWGFQSARFSGRLADLGGTSKLVGIIIFWMVAVFQFVTPFVVNVLFIRRYTHAGVILVWTCLGLALWINVLPSTNTFSFIVFIRNLLLGFFVSIIGMLWPMWCSIRGPDSIISRRVTEAKEFLHEQAYIQPVVYEASLDILGAEHQLPPLASNPRNSWEAAEILIMAMWCVFLVPLLLSWLVLINFLPFLQSKLPHAVALQVICSIALVAAVFFCAFAIAGSVFTQIHQEASIEYREQTLQLLEKSTKGD